MNAGASASLEAALVNNGASASSEVVPAVAGTHASLEAKTNSADPSTAIEENEDNEIFGSCTLLPDLASETNNHEMEANAVLVVTPSKKYKKKIDLPSKQNSVSKTPIATRTGAKDKTKPKKLSRNLPQRSSKN